MVAAAFDADHFRTIYLPRHLASELAEAAADVQDSFAGPQLYFGERIFVQQAVHQSEAILLLGVGAVEVVSSRVVVSVGHVRV